MNIGFKAPLPEMTQRSLKEAKILKDAATEGYFTQTVSLPNSTADPGNHLGDSIMEFGRNNSDGNTSP
jgi:hypothetical protein